MKIMSVRRLRTHDPFIYLKHLGLESSVNFEGTKTSLVGNIASEVLESSVNFEGTKTFSIRRCVIIKLESSVNFEGTKTQKND